MAAIRFGEIKGIKEGDVFINRRALNDAGIHRPLRAGIDGNGTYGCASIILSGGYIDDVDDGTVINYTGHGGQDSKTKKQIQDQSWDAYGNKGLLISELHGLPVRVIRGANHKSKYSPVKGYQYAGLYQVVRHTWYKLSGKFGVCKFELQKISSLVFVEEEPLLEFPSQKETPTIRVPTTLLRIVRDTAISRKVKDLYNYTCQVCNLRIEFNGVGYAEGAHIRPLGRPHNGSDSMGNLLCLCPNHHIMFDKGYFTIDKNFSLVGIPGKLNVHKNHLIDIKNINYHFNLRRKNL